MTRYFARLGAGKMILWCYLIWYLVTLYFYFDPALSIWLNSLGISAIIGIGLILSVSKGASSARDPWQTFRLFLMPFCVSSFSSLIKGKGYLLVIPPKRNEQLLSAGSCIVFIVLVFLLKFTYRKKMAGLTKLRHAITNGLFRVGGNFMRRCKLIPLFLLLIVTGAVRAQTSLGPKDTTKMPPADLSRLKIGDEAPDFTLEDQDAKQVMLSGYRGQKTVVLVFYRGYW